MYKLKFQEHNKTFKIKHRQSDQWGMTEEKKIDTLRIGVYVNIDFD